MGIVLNVVFVCALAAAFAIIAHIVNDVRGKKIDSAIGKISFRESMDLVQLPIVTFMNNGRKLNFLLDTGASYSSINEAVLNHLAYDKTGELGFGIGVEGVAREDREYVKMLISYKGKEYEDDFQVVDLSAAFGAIKCNYGVTLHGILSNTFFQKYRYILDFDELVAYSIV